MKIWLTIGSFVAVVAVVGVFAFEKTGEFSFVGFFSPFWEFLENISNLLKFVYNWFIKLIGWIAPNSVTA